MSRKIKQQRIELLQKLAKKALTTEQSDSNLFDFSYCKNCGCPCANDILCDDCDPLGYEDDEPDYSDFCGVQDQIAYQLKSGKSKNPLASLEGQWPGDESLEDLLKMLDE